MDAPDNVASQGTTWENVPKTSNAQTQTDSTPRTPISITGTATPAEILTGSMSNHHMASSDGPRRPVDGITPIQQMISSCSGAFLTTFLMTPLDVVKIRLQSQQHAFRQGSCFIYSNGLMDCLCVCTVCQNGKETGLRDCKITIKPWYNKPGEFLGTANNQPCFVHDVNCEHYGRAASNGEAMSVGRSPVHLRGTLDAFVKIARHEGLSALWSGLPPTLLMSIPATIFYFTAYDHLKYYMGYRENDSKTRHIPMFAGSTARIGTVILISPIELIRTKMQSQQLSYREVGKAVRVSIKQDGVLSMMRGVGPTLLRDVPFSALYWFGYEYVKALQLQIKGNKDVTLGQSFVAGATAGSIAGLLTLPFDVVKTHRQIQMGEAQLLKGTKVVSTYTVMSQIYKQNGVPALFAGIVPRLAKVAPACAIMISTYEYFKSYFRTRNSAKYAHNHGLVNSWN